MSEIKRYDAGSGVNPRSNGKYVLLADHQSAIDRLTAERDSAVADAQQLRDFADVEKNRLIAAAKRARRCIAWACDQRPEFNEEYDALNAAIDESMKEQEQGK